MMEDPTVLIELIAEQLKKIDRPVLREEFSFIPTHREVSDRVSSVKLSPEIEPVLVLSNPDETISLANAFKEKIMDFSDYKTMLYILSQIHD